MKKNYCDGSFTENSKIVHLMCSKELVRQVSVNCIERGSLLQEIINYFNESCETLGKNLQKSEAENEAQKKNFFQKFFEQEKAYKEKFEEMEKNDKKLEQKLEKNHIKTEKLKKSLKDQKQIIDELKFQIGEDNLYKFNFLLKKATVNSSGDIYSPKGFDSLKYNFSNYEENFSSIDESIQTDKKVFEIQVLDKVFIQSQQNLGVSNDENSIQDKLLISNSEFSIRLSSELNLHDNFSSDKDISPVYGKNLGVSRLQPKRPKKKESTQKINELEKKIKEKSLELSQIQKKIIEKQSELDFLSKTLDYKKFSASNSGTNKEFSEEKATNHLNHEDFNLLSDTKFWENNKTKPSRKSILRTNTMVGQDTTNMRNSQNLQEIDENMIKEEYSDQEIFDSQEPSYLDEEDFVFEYQPNDANLFENISKKIDSTNPLINLADTFDINLYKRSKASKKTPASKILKKICKKGLDWIKSKSTMSRKLINKLIFSLYMSFYAKKDNIEDLLDYVYFDFYQRYGLKYVSDKKFVEFISSLMTAEDSTRGNNFLKFIGAGQKIKKKNYSKESLKLYLEGLYFLISSKTGISSVENSDSVMVPLARSLDFVKEKLENIDKSKISRIVTILEYNSVPDPKKMVQSGIVNSEIVLENILDAYESLSLKYIESLQLLINALKYKETKDFLLKNEVCIMIRAVCSNKLEKFEVFYENNVSISLQEICWYSVENSLFSTEKIKAFCDDENKTVAETQDIVSQAIGKMNKIAKEIQNTEHFMKTLPFVI